MHFESFNEEYGAKVQEADEKISAFDKQHEQLNKLLYDFDEVLKQKNYSEQKLRETSILLGSVEESRKKEIHELQRLRDENEMSTKDLAFYKQECERLQHSLKENQHSVDSQLRNVRSKDLEARESAN